MIYAPVIIPTLNRYEHLKNLISSLQKNSFAKYTELYIGLDYPPSDKYEDGYRKVCKYLETDIEGFKKVNVIKREKNYGAGKNTLDLMQRVYEKYDRYIFSEDDNVFSENFLEYIDRALEYYEDDPKIRSVCGYSYPIEYNASKKNVMAMTCFNAWGYGTWRDKRTEDRAEANTDYFAHKLRNFIKAAYCVKANVESLNYVLSCVLNGQEVIYGDYKLTVYNNLNKYYSLIPVKTMVHNCGFDGSGLHCGDSSRFDWINSEPLYSAEAFIPDKTYSVWNSCDMKNMNLLQNVTMKGKIRLYILLFLYMLVGAGGTRLLLKQLRFARSVLNRKKK